MQVVLVHETDPARGGCEFDTFFLTTPPDLIDSTLYKLLAIAFVSGENHRKVSGACGNWIQVIVSPRKRSSMWDHIKFELNLARYR